MSNRYKPAIERFWAKVDKNGPNGCWNWIGSKWKAGYGKFRSNNKYILAHRYSYKLVGEIPDGLTIDHHTPTLPTR